MLAKLLIVVMVAFHGWMSYMSISSTSHDPVLSGEHASSVFDGHSHSHDDPGTHDPGKQHTHTAWDHSHDKSNLTCCYEQIPFRSGEAWDAALPISAYPAPYFAFERPPKSI